MVKDTHKLILWPENNSPQSSGGSFFCPP
uniref:Uncharacterized protein n=1 Tax=Anguilla anguilla TaxID=7936 RepID=A0A0E9UH12_ANGAN